jgi:import inner membrane translocase subunit TIM23
MAHHGWREEPSGMLPPDQQVPNMYSPYSLDPNYLPKVTVHVHGWF